MNDWRASLQNFLNSNPDLPEENSSAETDAANKTDTGAGSHSNQPVKLRKITVAFERKGRGGKSATIIADFPPEVTDDEIAVLAARLKQRLGTGGSSRGGEILIQGDKREQLRPLLAAEGYKFS